MQLGKCMSFTIKNNIYEGRFQNIFKEDKSVQIKTNIVTPM